MPLSRLRLQIAIRFTTAVLLAVAVVDVGLTAYLWREADSRVTRELEAAVLGLRDAIRREGQEPEATRERAVHDALEEWPHDQTAFAVYAPDRTPLGARGPEPLQPLLRLPAAPVAGAVWSDRLDAEGNLRAAVGRDTVFGGVWIVAGRSTADVRERGELLTGWLLVSLPGLALFSLVAGYWLARRALQPLRDMADAIEGIAPDDLARRLPVRTPPDEIDRLADRFNGLLERLAHARDRNRTFVARAAHQLRTPLTIVRGESTLGLERPRDEAAYRRILERVRRAADQMTHRVDDLLLLARAEADDRPPTEDVVELDGLALECADLMRGRAQQTHHVLELDRVEGGEARGNEALLREALLELLENAVRHGGTDGPIRVSAYAEGDRACLVVASPGPPLPADRLSAPAHRDGPAGLGLSIVGWIARVHGGTLMCHRQDGRNALSLCWPRGRPGPAG